MFFLIPPFSPPFTTLVHLMNHLGMRETKCNESHICKDPEGGEADICADKHTWRQERVNNRVKGSERITVSEVLQGMKC